MELCGINIPDEMFFKPIYISSRTTSLTAAFNPKDRVVPSHIAYTQYVGNASDQRALIDKLYDCRMLEFSIRKLRSKEPPIRIRLSFWFLYDLHKAIKSTKDGTWIDTATYYHLLKHPELGNLPCDEWSALVHIPNSVEPLVLIETGVRNWPGTTAGSVTMGSNLTIYFQPKAPKENNVKKPWTWEFTHYQLQCHTDLSVTQSNERKLSIQMSDAEIEQIVDHLGKNLFVWDGIQTTEQLFGASSAVSG